SMIVPGYTSTNHYLTPASYKNSIDVNFIPSLQQHDQNTSDPHRLTPQHVGSNPKTVSDDLLSRKQDADKVVISSWKVENKNYNEIENLLLSAIPSSNLTSGTVKIE